MKTAILIVFTLILIYFLVFVSIKLIKPKILIKDNKYMEWYGYLMYPIRYSVEYISDYERVRDDECYFEGCNIYGDRIFFSKNGKTYSANADFPISKFALTLKNGDFIHINTILYLGSDENLKDYFVLGIKKIELIKSIEDMANKAIHRTAE